MSNKIKAIFKLQKSELALEQVSHHSHGKNSHDESLVRLGDVLQDLNDELDLLRNEILSGGK